MRYQRRFTAYQDPVTRGLSLHGDREKTVACATAFPTGCLGQRGLFPKTNLAPRDTVANLGPTAASVAPTRLRADVPVANADVPASGADQAECSIPVSAAEMRPFPQPWQDDAIGTKRPGRVNLADARS